MQRVPTTTVANPLWKRIVAALFLLAFLSIHTVAACEQVHHEIHHDASAPAHDCVFVHVSAGQCLGEIHLISAPRPVVTQVSVAASIIAFVLPSRDFVLLPGRAPPTRLG